MSGTWARPGKLNILGCGPVSKGGSVLTCRRRGQRELQLRQLSWPGGRRRPTPLLMRACRLTLATQELALGAGSLIGRSRLGTNTDRFRLAGKSRPNAIKLNQWAEREVCDASGLGTICQQRLRSSQKCKLQRAVSTAVAVKVTSMLGVLGRCVDLM